MKIIFGALLAFVISTFVYFGFVNNYSSSLFNHAKFVEQYNSGIYQYRILSSHLLLLIYSFLETLNLDYSILKLKFLDKSSEPQMFLAFYILNTFFLVLSGILLVFIMEMKSFIATQSEKLLLLTVAVLTIGLSQFVIVPYDVPGYFFLLLFYYFLIKYLRNQDFSVLIFLGIILLISTLIRESSALSLSLAATLLTAKFGLKKEALFPLFFLVLIFLSVYVGLRLNNGVFTTTDGNLFTLNISQPKNILGIIFWLVMFSLTLFLAKDKNALKKILVFHAFSLPYIYICIYGGILYEIRLYIPVFLTALLLARTDFAKIR